MFQPGKMTTCKHEPCCSCCLFVSVAQCNSFGNVAASRTSCITTDSSSTLVGAAHMHYDCVDKSFWVLTYAFTDIGFSNSVNDMWINTDCGACDSAAGPKEIAYSGDATSGNCASTPCTAATCSGSSCSVCCNDMWPVIDNGRWVGYLAKAHFGLPSGALAAWDSVLVHWDWTSSPSVLTGTNTASSSTASGAPGACWQCSGEGLTIMGVCQLNGQLNGTFRACSCSCAVCRLTRTLIEPFSSTPCLPECSANMLKAVCRTQ